jgi:ABC-type transporter Mla subunit MlaD
MSKTFNIGSKYKFFILIPFFILLILTIIFFGYKLFYGPFITAKFPKSGPLSVNMPVYYKGYHIGQTVGVKLSEDYKYSLVKIMLYPSKIKLPENVEAKAKKPDSRKDYIDLVNPEQPSIVLLKNGGIIDGQQAFDMETFLSEIADSGIIVPLLQNFSDTLVSAGETSDEIKNFFSDFRSVLQENRQNLKQASKELAQSTKSLSKLTSKFNNSITEEKLNSTTSTVDKSANNILAASENIKNITANVDCATRNIDKTVAKIDSTVSDAKAITCDVKTITSGFREVLSKRFAGLRIIFGKPVKNNKCPMRCLK